MFTQLSLDLRMMDFNRFVAGVISVDGGGEGGGGGGWWVVVIQVHTLTCGY